MTHSGGRTAGPRALGVLGLLGVLGTLGVVGGCLPTTELRFRADPGWDEVGRIRPYMIARWQDLPLKTVRPVDRLGLQVELGDLELQAARLETDEGPIVLPVRPRRVLAGRRIDWPLGRLVTPRELHLLAGSGGATDDATLVIVVVPTPADGASQDAPPDGADAPPREDRGF